MPFVRLSFMLLLLLVRPAQADEADGKAILVTGASSGIGLAITRHLSSNGHFVYAGARKDEDLERLDAMDNVQALRLDVTFPEHVAAAVQIVANEGRGLYGVVNNAGVASLGPLIETDIAEMEWLFDVNVYGPYRVTQAFAPMLLESGGRVVNISSISGILSGGTIGIYSMSKHALEAYTDSLAAELQPFGVSVSAVEPGNFNSDIGSTIEARLRSGNVDLDSERYGDRLKLIAQSAANREQYPEPVTVAAAVERALFDEQPRRRYMVTGNQREAEITIAKAIEELVQLNGDHAHSYGRDELVRMLDAALQRERLAAREAGTITDSAN